MTVVQSEPFKQSRHVTGEGLRLVTKPNLPTPINACYGFREVLVFLVRNSPLTAHQEPKLSVAEYCAIETDDNLIFTIKQIIYGSFRYCLKLN